MNSSSFMKLCERRQKLSNHTFAVVHLTLSFFKDCSTSNKYRFCETNNITLNCFPETTGWKNLCKSFCQELFVMWFLKNGALICFNNTLRDSSISYKISDHGISRICWSRSNAGDRQMRSRQNLWVFRCVNCLIPYKHSTFPKKLRRKDFCVYSHQESTRWSHKLACNRNVWKSEEVLEKRIPS